MIKEINPVQLAVICDWPKDRAVVVFHKIDHPKEDLRLAVYKNSDIKKWYISVEKLEIATNLPIGKMISDVQANFTRNKSCMEYVYKSLSKKIVPNAKTGLYPLSIKIPADVSFLISDDQRQEIIDKAFDYLPIEDQHNITKHKIIIK